MAIVKVKADLARPPWRRQGGDRPHLLQGRAESTSLLEPQKQNSGRNNNGHITVRHKGGGQKPLPRGRLQARNKVGIPAKVERIEYDPNRTAFIALLCYADGERRYILARAPSKVGRRGAVRRRGRRSRPGNAMPIRKHPVGRSSTTSSCPARARRSRARREPRQTLGERHLRAAASALREVRKVHIDCRATIGEVSNEEHSLRHRQGRCIRWRASARPCAASR